MDNQFRNSYLLTYLKNIKKINVNEKFHCLNPEHHDQNPSMSYNAKNNTIHCFSCKQTYDLIQLIIVEYQTDYFDALRIIDLLICYNFSDLASVNLQQHQYQNYDLSKQTKYIKQINECDYLEKRGISFASAIKCQIGYNKEKNTLMIPAYFPSPSLLIRFLNPDSKHKYLFVKNHCASITYNLKINETLQIYLVEGIFDALSLVEMHKNFICLNGVGQLNKAIGFIQELNKLDNYEFIIAFDDDSAGNKAKQKLKQFFIQAKLNYTYLNLDGAKDVNEYFLWDIENFEKTLYKSEYALSLLRQ